MSDIEQNVTPEPHSISETVLEPIVEVVNEEKTQEALLVSISENLFIDVVKKSLENEEIKNKMMVKLTPEVIKIINNIISLTPNTLTDIEKAIVEIVKDGKIDSNDIPNLIVIIQRIYQFIYSLKTVKFDGKKRSEITSTFLKFLIHLLVLEGKLKIDENIQAFTLLQLDTLIDSCISLLSYSKSIKTKGCIKF